MSGNPPVVYRARTVCPSVKLTDDLAREIAIELEPLGGSGKTLRQIPARAIVEHSRNPSSALHGIIWGRPDDELAYEARCQLARQVVNSIRIVATDEDGEFSRPLLVTVRMNPHEKRGYVPTDVAAGSDYMAEQIELRATARLKGWLDEFRAFRHGPVGLLWDSVNAAVQAAASQSTTPVFSAAQRVASSRNAKRRAVTHITASTSQAKKSA